MQTKRTRESYEPANVRIAHSAILEVASALQSYKDAMVLIGGWVPYLLLERHQRTGNPFRHVGSMDSDWVLDPRFVDSQRYETIVEALARRGFVQSKDSLFRLEKKGFTETGTEITVAVDFLTEVVPKGQGSRHRHRELQPGLRARTTEAAEIALEHFATIELEGELPGGGHLTVPIQMADVAGSIGTKGLALGGRFAEKDCYDLYALIANYGDGPVDAAAQMRLFINEPLLKASLEHIHRWFKDIGSAGPVAVANFFPNVVGEARERIVRDAFQSLSRFLRELGFV